MEQMVIVIFCAPFLVAAKRLREKVLKHGRAAARFTFIIHCLDIRMCFVLWRAQGWSVQHSLGSQTVAGDKIPSWHSLVWFTCKVASQFFHSMIKHCPFLDARGNLPFAEGSLLQSEILACLCSACNQLPSWILYRNGLKEAGMVIIRSMISNASVALLFTRLGSYHQSSKSWGKELPVLVLASTRLQSQHSTFSWTSLPGPVMALVIGPPGFSSSAWRWLWEHKIRE